MNLFILFKNSIVISLPLHFRLPEQFTPEATRQDIARCMSWVCKAEETQWLRARRQPEWVLCVVGGGGWPKAACRNPSVMRRVSACGGKLVSTSGA